MGLSPLPRIHSLRTQAHGDTPEGNVAQGTTEERHFSKDSVGILCIVDVLYIVDR